MSEIGADPDELDSLADALAAAATSLAGSGGRLDRAVGSAAWWGPDARRFRSGWAARHGSLRSAADTLRGAAQRLRAEAAEQRRASEGSGTPLVAPVLPLRSERWQLGLRGGAGIDAGVRGELDVDDLPGPTSRVTLELDGSVGAGAGVGGGVELHGAEALGGEGRTDGGAAVTSTGSETWIVPDAEAASFGRARAAEAAIDLVPGMAVARGGLQSLLGVSPPPPETRTAMVGVALGATASGTAGPLSGRLDDASTAQVGVRRRGGRTSLVLHVEGAGAARLPGLLFGESAPHVQAFAVESDIEVFPARDGIRTVVVTSTSLEAGQAVRVVSTIAVDDARGGAALDRAWRDLNRGDLDRAVHHLGDLGDAVRSVGVDSVAGDVDGTTRGATATSSDGARAHAGAEVAHQVIDWHPRR